MTNLDNIQSYIVSFGIALIGGWGNLLQTLLIFMLVDILTGIIKAWRNGAFTSKEMRQGLVHKAGFFLVIILANQLDQIAGGSVATIGSMEISVRDATCLFYMAVEGSSVLENLGEMGVAIPNFIKKGLARIKEMSGETENKDIQNGEL